VEKAYWCTVERGERGELLEELDQRGTTSKPQGTRLRANLQRAEAAADLPKATLERNKGDGGRP